MPKSDFISDKLIDISDRFKRDYAERNHLVPAEAASAAPQPATGNPSADARELRELQERIARDTSAAQASLEELDVRRGELQRFLELAAQTRERCQSLEGKSASGDVGKLRIEYFGASGRITLSAPVSAPAVRDAEPRSRREIWREALPVMAAVIAASLIVAGTLFALLA